jgi:hypothetical protein
MWPEAALATKNANAVAINQRAGLLQAVPTLGSGLQEPQMVRFEAVFPHH